MQTTPLAKAITTTEGILTILINAVLGLAAFVPTHGLNPTVAAVVSGATTVALTAQRGLVKAKALQATPVAQELLSGQYVAAPIEPDPAVAPVAPVAPTPPAA